MCRYFNVDALCFYVSYASLEQKHAFLFHHRRRHIYNGSTSQVVFVVAAFQCIVVDLIAAETLCCALVSALFVVNVASVVIGIRQA